MRAEMLWAVGTSVVGGYLMLFAMARRPVTLRPARIGCLVAIFLGLRLVLAGAGVPVEGTWEVVGMVLAGAAAAVLVLARRIWLVRTTAEELRERIRSVCRGLFLGVREAPAGRLQLASQVNLVLRLRRLAPRLQLLVLCPTAESGKVALLCGWLAKQYPGPVPRLRITLKGGAS